MARLYGKLFSAAWDDETWLGLSLEARAVYTFSFSHANVSRCGTWHYTPASWAQLMRAPVAKVKRSVKELEAAGMFVIDNDHAELVVRSFAKHDGFLDNPNLVKAMWRAYGLLVSKKIKRVILDNLPEHAFSAHVEAPDEALALVAAALVTEAEIDQALRTSQNGGGCNGLGEPLHETLPESTFVPLKPSSSSGLETCLGASPEGLDDEELRIEAKRRLVQRESKLGPVANPEAWMRRAVRTMRAEGWKPELHPTIAKAKRERCDNPECSSGYVIADDGAAHRCGRCNAA